MPKSTRNPAVLLRLADNSPAAEGDVLPSSLPGHQVRLVNMVPDADGMITVQDTYLARPEDVGLYYRPASVTMELTDDEAAVLLKLYQAQALTPPLPPDFLQAPQPEQSPNLKSPDLK